MKNILKLTICLMLLASSYVYSQAAVENEDDGQGIWYAGLTLDVIAVTAYDSFSYTSDPGRLGAIGKVASFGPLLGYDSKAVYFEDTRFGFFFSSQLGLIDVDEQIRKNPSTDPSDYEDMGTRVRGFYAYFTPSVFHEWGVKSPEKTDDIRWRLGVGLGLSYLHLRGDMVLTELAVPEEVDVSVNNIGYSLLIMGEFRKGPWIIRSTSNAPVVKDDGKTFALLDASIEFGYAIGF